MKLLQSILGNNYRYLSYRYVILPRQWFGPLKTLHQSIDSYVVLNIRELPFAHVIRELCLCRDSTDTFVHLVEKQFSLLNIFIQYSSLLLLLLYLLS